MKQNTWDESNPDSSPCSYSGDKAISKDRVLPIFAEIILLNCPIHTFDSLQATLAAPIPRACFLPLLDPQSDRIWPLNVPTQRTCEHPRWLPAAPLSLMSNRYQASISMVRPFAALQFRSLPLTSGNIQKLHSNKSQIESIP